MNENHGASSRRPFPLDYCRQQFPAFERQVSGKPAVFFDGPAGSQVPGRVIEAVSRYLAQTNANCGGLFATSQESDAKLLETRLAMADLLGAADPEPIAFGPNMTTLTLSLSRALSRTWEPGDEIIVSDLDHDANVTPWVLAARDAGVTVKRIALRPDDVTLDLDDLREKLSRRVRLVAVTCASNAVGSINPVERIAELAHEVGALVFLDAVHYAPHGRIEVDSWDCDFLACSAYKFFGPHLAVLWGRRSLMSELPVYKLRPAPDDPSNRWMTGTQNHEGIAGAGAAVEYLADLGRRVAGDALSRSAALDAAFEAIVVYEAELARQLLDGLGDIDAVRVHGITDLSRLSERVPTVSITHERHRPRDLAGRLAAEGIFTWHGNYYALPVTEALGLEPHGMLRIGLLHYNTTEEVGRLLDVLKRF